MKFLEFLAVAKKKTFWDNLDCSERRVICFTSDQYPLFFFRTLFDYLKSEEVLSASYLRPETTKQLWQTLKQSFLGETSFYWLGSITETMKKNQTAPIEVLSHYRGPNSIAFFLPLDYKLSVSARKRMTVVDMGTSLSSFDVPKLFSFFGVNLNPSKRAALQEIIQRADTINFDIACMLINYLTVTNVKMIDSLQNNIAGIIAPELSLFALSSAFFKKQKSTFFSLWKSCCNDYSVPFWTAYWSEQLWRAYYVVMFLKQNNFPAARRFSYRLPSSFIRYDWHNCCPNQLKGAHAMLYDIDFACKTGSVLTQNSALYSFDLLYCTYFLNKFAHD